MGGAGGQGGAALTSPLRCPQVGGGHSEDSLVGGGSLMHNHVALPSQPSSLPDLARPPDSYSGKPQRGGPGRGGLCPDPLRRARLVRGVPLNDLLLWRVVT